MRKILLLSFVAALSASGISQTQLENPGFEGAWENVTGAEDEPVEWSSLKTADALASLAPVVAFQEATNPHSGARCIRLLNVSSFGVVANGLLTNGLVHADFDPDLGYVYTNTTDPQWNTTFTDRPDSLVGWFRYSPSGADKGKVEVITHQDPPVGQLPAANYPEAHWVSRARYDVTTTSASTWIRFSVPFEYYNTSLPEYILVVLSAGDSTIAVAGSQMWIDDLELIYNPNLVSVTPPASQNINMGVNGTTLTVNATPNAAVVTPVTQEWKYSTTSGSGYVSFGVPETGTTYTPNFAAAGIYYVVCDVDFGTEIITSNEVEIVVTDPGANSVTISPSAPQTLLVGQNGTLMTATESPAAASSREWLFSVTSGSGYAPFTTPVTGLTYTPNFNAVGTYYVICQSDFSGDVQISNEVTIMVPSAAGIDEEHIQFNLYNNGNALSLRMSDIQSNSTFSLFSLDGKLIYSSALTEENTLHSIDAKGVFVYHVVTGDKIITGKINL
ncbi:MAG: PCMD domain-containing protein [Bacteroidetes bacterium]|nr:PCMD domain-containing protein [Bacteroidota bacterium]